MGGRFVIRIIVDPYASPATVGQSRGTYQQMSRPSGDQETEQPIIIPPPPTTAGQPFDLAIEAISAAPDSVRYELQTAGGAFLETLATADEATGGTFSAVGIAPLVIGTYGIVAVAIYGLIELVSDVVELVVEAL